ncbi:hypothetical protein [Demequina globuliformis]|uniref:hypothetical protein n=1 Tax=Demequina globuliformis TaxID=676202 RepID=UPI00078197AD|nr:hypothetical protein [Demequina globuliformis]
MDITEKEPTPTIRGELGRRRLAAGRLAAAAEMSDKTLQGRLNDPDTFRLGELARIATALDIERGSLLGPWLKESEK